MTPYNSLLVITDRESKDTPTSGRPHLTYVIKFELKGARLQSGPASLNFTSGPAPKRCDAAISHTLGASIYAYVVMR